MIFIQRVLCFLWKTLYELDINHIQPQTMGDYFFITCYNTTFLFKFLFSNLLDTKVLNVISKVLRYNPLWRHHTGIRKFIQRISGQTCDKCIWLDENKNDLSFISYIFVQYFLVNLKERQAKPQEAFQEICTHEDILNVCSFIYDFSDDMIYLFIINLVWLNGYIIYQTLYLNQCFFCPMIDYMPSLPYYKDSVIKLFYDQMNDK